VTAIDDPGVTVRRTEHEAVANLRIVLELCASGGLRCSEKTRRPAATSVTGIALLLAAGDFYPSEPIAAYAWPLLVQAGSLAELAGNRLQLTTRGRAALTAPPSTAIRDLWRRWGTHAVIDELSRVETIKGQRSANVLTAAKTRRQAVVTALGRCTAGTWVGIDELFRQMRRANLSPTVARSERSLWKLYINDAQYGSLGYAGFHDWSVLEGRYTLAVLFEYAATLGLIDIAYTDPAGARDDFRENWGTDELEWLSRYDGMRAIRINALGSYVLGLAEHPPPTTATEAETGKPIKVLPNHDVVALGDLPLGDQMTLSAFADQTADRVWRLTEASMTAGVANGRRLEELLHILDRASDRALPATVNTLIADVRNRCAAVTDRGMVRLVECRDAATAKLIAGDRRTSRLCVQIGELHLTVGVEHEVAFRAALARLGYVLPAGSGVTTLLA
jgi:hypothetical protein